MGFFPVGTAVAVAGTSNAKTGGAEARVGVKIRPEPETSPKTEVPEPYNLTPCVSKKGVEIGTDRGKEKNNFRSKYPAGGSNGAVSLYIF